MRAGHDPNRVAGAVAPARRVTASQVLLFLTTGAARALPCSGPVALLAGKLRPFARFAAGRVYLGAQGAERRISRAQIAGFSGSTESSADADHPVHGNNGAALCGLVPFATTDLGKIMANGENSLVLKEGIWLFKGKLFPFPSGVSP